jgi:mannose-6-phosphate isomerase-like protein (cupin superfamily)
MIGRPADLGGTTNHSFVHVVIPAGSASPAHYHKVSEETYYVLSGEGRLSVNGVDKIVKARDACLIMPGEVHQITNEANETLEFLTVSAPAWQPNDTYTV